MMNNWDATTWARFIDDLDYEAHKSGFSVSSNSVDDIQVKSTSRDWSLSGGHSFEPELTIDATPNDAGDGYWFTPTVKIPVIRGEDTQFADDFQYIFKRYADDVGRFCTVINNLEYRPEDYMYEDDEEY